MLSTKFISATKEFNTLKKNVPAPYIRKTFTLKSFKNAEVYICGLGFYEFYLNGQKLTKSGTISFRGTQRDLLEQFGGLFKLEPYVENMYRLIAIEEIDLYENEEDFKDEINNLNEINYGNV